MRVQYKLDRLGKVECFSILEDGVNVDEGFLVAESEKEFEDTTGHDLSGITCEYSENKCALLNTDQDITRPLEDVILALLQAGIDLPTNLVEKVIDKQEKRNKFIGSKGVIVTKQGSCYHTNDNCSSLADAEINYVTKVEALKSGLTLCSKC